MTEPDVAFVTPFFSKTEERALRREEAKFHQEARALLAGQKEKVFGHGFRQHFFVCDIPPILSAAAESICARTGWPGLDSVVVEDGAAITTDWRGLTLSRFDPFIAVLPVGVPATGFLKAGTEKKFPIQRYFAFCFIAPGWSHSIRVPFSNKGALLITFRRVKDGVDEKAFARTAKRISPDAVDRPIEIT